MGLFGLFIVCLLYQSFGSCWSLSDEGLALLDFKHKIVNDPFGALANWSYENGKMDPCSWFGVDCSDSKVVSLNLKNLRLEGTITPEIARLTHIKSIILRNNSFSGQIPQGIGNLQSLEVIDLRRNCFDGPLPSNLLSNIPNRTIILDGNKLLGSSSPGILKLHLLSRTSRDQKSKSRWVCADKLLGEYEKDKCNFPKGNGRFATQAGNLKPRKLLQDNTMQMFIFPPILPNFPPSLRSPSPSPDSLQSPVPSPGSPPSPVPSPASPPSPVPSPENESSVPEPSIDPTPPPTHNVRTPAPSPSENRSSATGNRKSSSIHVRLLVGFGGAIFLIVLGVCVYFSVFKKEPVRPWATGLSRQLEKAFVTGVPNLKRSELETACEDFSNVIGVTPIGTLYKGTLSSGIAVACLAAKSTKDWPKKLDREFRTKIDTLSKVNHKNFVNLIGYCEEERPFTRMMVFEYAPNGTLFEHLHIQEAEHLDWGMRLRIAVGMASCLQHMHQLNPPLIHENLTSSTVSLTEDYAAKLADMSFWSETIVAESDSSIKTLSGSSGSSESNVYSFGVMVFEMMTGRVPYSVDCDSLEDWAADYLRGDKSLREIVDPTLKHWNPEQLGMIDELIKLCTNPDSMHRPEMAGVSCRLRSITGISPEEASPRLSPLWWAELEIMSTEAH